MICSSGLPLLIANGKFVTLNSMTVEDLEEFIPYLVECSVTKGGALLKNGVPEWWSSIIQYQIPIKKPFGLSDVGFHSHLSALVHRCYWFHNALNILSISAKLAKASVSISCLETGDKRNSCFYLNNIAPIMKLSGASKNYDPGSKKNGKPYRRCLLFSLPKKSISLPDIYLCENCDAEFNSYSEMQKHEKECCEVIKIDESSDESEELEILEHINHKTTSVKSDLLNYLGLKPISNEKACSVIIPRRCNTEYNPKRRVNVNKCLQGMRNVEFSSIFGRKLLECSVNSDIDKKIAKNILSYESYCNHNKGANREPKKSAEFKVSYRKAKNEVWSHQYSFGKTQRNNRYSYLKTGLNEQSRILLKQCKTLKIVLKRIKVKS